LPKISFDDIADKEVIVRINKAVELPMEIIDESQNSEDNNSKKEFLLTVGSENE
jgi:hypothetical protein